MVFRALFVFALITGLAAAAAWFANHPGSVAIDWGSWRIETSVPVLLLAIAVVTGAAAVLYHFWRVLVATPRAIGRARRERRRNKGYLALTRGMVAVAAGDPEEARRQAKLARNLVDEPPLTLLLSAQAAQLEGRETAAKEYFTAMLERPETEFLAIRGLLMQAEREGDRARALELARRARRLRPKTKWVLSALFELEARSGHWKEAETILRDAIRHDAVPAAESRRHRAAVLLQRALASEGAGDPDAALRFAKRAHEADETFLPAAVDLARRFLGSGRLRAARNVVEQSWPHRPQPDLARIYGEATGARDPVRRLQAIERLRDMRPDHAESHLALAHAALEARLWGEARRHLAAVSGDAARTRRYCRLMAEIEEAENGDSGAVRQWLARAASAPADAGWICSHCGARAQAWHAVCANCGAFGGIDWRLPPTAPQAIAAKPDAGAGDAAPLEAPEEEPAPATVPATGSG